MKKFWSTGFLILGSLGCFAGNAYWQQRVHYEMHIVMNVQTNRFEGTQKLEYWNNSSDTLYKIFYHLYWNAFHPGSMMSAGWKKVNDLDSTTIGYQHVKWLKLDGILQKMFEQETILEIILIKPILPHTKVLLEMAFEAQVPLEIGRRAGRDNAAGVKYSMAQWYPKICEYDREGWHADPYCSNGEFYGVWGDFDVSIEIDKNYILGATGYLQNPNQIGYGYEVKGTKVMRSLGGKLNWRFIAPNVHDFVWAADSNYKHLIRKIKNGPVIHVLYSQNRVMYDRYQYYKQKRFDTIEKWWLYLDSSWNHLADELVTIYPFAIKMFGDYPYKQFSVINGGDASMEYPMATLTDMFDIDPIFHEFMHQWYYGMVATNETEHPWMDEGFTVFAGYSLVNYFNNDQKKISKSLADPMPPNIFSAYEFYNLINKEDKSEPISTWSDHFSDPQNYTYSIFKGMIFLNQLGYIVGDEIRDKILLEYYRKWKFKHPFPEDFVRIAENVSGMQLGWYYMYWVNTTKDIDYSIDSVWSEGGRLKIKLKKIGSMPMPIDLVIESKDGSKELVYIPQYLMFGAKLTEDPSICRTVLVPWKSTDSTYTIEIDKAISYVKKMEIDPSQRMADVDRSNNIWINISK